MARIGQNQLRILIMTASPTRRLITTDKVSDALVRRGLLRDLNGAAGITPAGLRALADEMEAGRVEGAIEAMKRDVAAQRAKVEARRRKAPACP